MDEKFIHVRSAKFPILSGEAEELVNEGMYGKALAIYLQSKLNARGYKSPFYCCEDWGWWIELKDAPFTLGVRIYSGFDSDSLPKEGEPIVFSCTAGAAADRKWSWKKFRFVDTRPWTHKLHEDLLAIFQADQKVEVVGVNDDVYFAK